MPFAAGAGNGAAAVSPGLLGGLGQKLDGERELPGEHDEGVLVFVAEALLVRAFDVEDAEQPAARSSGTASWLPEFGRPGNGISVSKGDAGALRKALAGGVDVTVLLHRVADADRRALAGRTPMMPSPMRISDPTPDSG